MRKRHRHNQQDGFDESYTVRYWMQDEDTKFWRQKDDTYVVTVTDKATGFDAAEKQWKEVHRNHNVKLVYSSYN